MGFKFIGMVPKIYMDAFIVEASGNNSPRTHLRVLEEGLNLGEKLLERSPTNMGHYWTIGKSTSRW